jgi:hypothetical protein
MAVRQFDAVAEIQSAFQILIKNWMLAVPTAVSSLIATLYAFFVLVSAMAAIGLGSLGGSSGLVGGLSAFGGVTGLGLLAICLISLIAASMVMASAEDAWSGRPVDLSKALSRALACLVNVIIAGIVVGIIFAISVFTVVGWIVVAYLFMYVLPAIVVGNAGAFEAMGESFRLTTKNFVPSIAAFIGIALAVLVGGLVNNLFVHIIGLNFIIGLVVGGFTSALAALISVRFYDLLRSGTPVAPTTTTTT